MLAAAQEISVPTAFFSLALLHSVATLVLTLEYLGRTHPQARAEIDGPPWPEFLTLGVKGIFRHLRFFLFGWRDYPNDRQLKLFVVTFWLSAAFTIVCWNWSAATS